MFYGLVQYPSSWHVKPSAPGWKLRSNACHWEKTTSLDSRHPWQHHDPNKITTSRKVTRDPQWLAKKKTNKTQVALCQAMSSLMLNAFYCTKLVLVDTKTDRSLKGILSKKISVMRMHAGKQLEALLPLPDGASQASLIVFIIWMKQERARGLRVAYTKRGDANRPPPL